MANTICSCLCNFISKQMTLYESKLCYLDLSPQNVRATYTCHGESSDRMLCNCSTIIWYGQTDTVEFVVQRHTG